ncbi:MAG TPA: hypothetical protein VH763_18900 [Gemmatimonadales bacterium]
MRRDRWYVLLALLALSPVLLRAQDRRLSDRLDPATATSVQQLIDSARALKLPTEPLVQKALEGSTMGASGDRIRMAVEALFGQLGRAREALGTGASEAELTAGAGALRAGLAPASLAELHRLRYRQSLAVPIAVLADLVAEGVPAAQATREVFQLAREGRPDDEFVALRRRVQSQKGGDPGSAEPLQRPAAAPAADPPSEAR